MVSHRVWLKKVSLSVSVFVVFFVCFAEQEGSNTLRFENACPSLYLIINKPAIVESAKPIFSVNCYKINILPRVNPLFFVSEKM